MTFNEMLEGNYKCLVTIDVADAVHFQQRGTGGLEFLGVSGTAFGCCWAAAVAIRRPGEADFVERAVQHFHEAMSVGVIVNGRTVTLAPAEQHQIEFAITFVH
jgi:hypothetical protein